MICTHNLRGGPIGSDAVKIIAIAVVCAVVAGSLTFAVTMNNVEKNDDSFDADAYYEEVKRYASDIRKITDFQPDIAIVLGSGMGELIDKVDVVSTIPYSSLEGFPVSTVQGHAGNFVLGTLGDAHVIVMQGRIHYYEGYSMYDVVLPLRVMHELGATSVIFTNAVGSINPSFIPGSFMVVKDHISSLIPSPLIGENIDALGPRFVAMTDVYDMNINQIVKDVAAEKSTPEHAIIVNEGVFIQVTGPQYETPAECAMYSMWGADTVGMSTVCESITAAHMGMRVCAINCITNMSYDPTTHDDVQETMDIMNVDLGILLVETIKEMIKVNG